MNDKEYKDFMWNSKNAYRCSSCPENRQDYNGRYPCGQQNCWVVCYSRASHDANDAE